MQIVYNGPHPEVVVDALDSEKVIVRGEAVDVPDSLAARLLEQDTWATAEVKPAPSQAPTPAPAPLPVPDNTATKGSN